MVDRIVKVVLRGEIGDLKAKLSEAGRALADTAGKMTAAGAEGEKFRRGLDDLGSTAGKVGLAAAGGLGAVIVASSNFEQAMSDVQAATHESAMGMEALRDAALEAGKETAFSASEAAAGIENLAKAGVDTQDIIGGGLAGALDLAAAGGMGVAEAAEAAAGAMAQFKLEGEDVPHIADLLAAGAGKAQGEVSDMVMALKQAGTVSAQTGLSLEETTGALAAMAEQSLLGSDAGTSFKTMLASLTPNSDAAAAAMEQYNIHAFDAQGNFVGMTELAGQLRDGLGKLTNEQRASTLETIFGSDAVRAASIVYDQGEDGIRKWISAVDDQGYAAETARIKLDNLKGDVEALGGSVETVLIGMGEGSRGPLRGMVQGATDAVNAFGELPESMQGAVTGMLAITAITGGAAWFGTKVIGGISNAKDALINLGLSADQAQTKLSRIGSLAAKGAGLIAVGMAVGAIADNLNRIDTRNLNRSLDALGRGVTTDTIDQVISSLEELTALRNKVDLGEIVTGFGLFTASSMDRFAENVESVDQALAGMVESGNGQEAARLFSRLVELADDSGISLEQVRDRFDAYALAVDNATPNTNLLASAFTVLDDALGQLPVQADAATKAQEKLDAAAVQAKEAAWEQARAWGGLGDSVGDAEVSLQGWLKSLEEQSVALNNFADNIEWAKGKLEKGLIQSFIEAGEVGAMRLEQLANASKSELDRANKAWRDQQKAIENAAGVLDDYNGMPVKPKVPKVDPKPAKRAIDTIIDQLLRIPDGHATLYVDAVVSGAAAGALAGLAGARGSADGSTVPDDGGPYSDRFLYALAPGEEVISNRHGQADAGRKAAKMINAGHLTDAMLGLADGGTAHGYTVRGHVEHGGFGGGGFGGGLSGHDIDRIVDGLARLRPLYGDVRISGDPTVFRREMEADAQRAAITGVR